MLLILLIQTSEIARRVAGDDPLLWALVGAVMVLSTVTAYLFKKSRDDWREHSAALTKLIESNLSVLKSLEHELEGVGSELPRLGETVGRDLREGVTGIKQHITNEIERIKHIPRSS